MNTTDLEIVPETFSNPRITRRAFIRRTSSTVLVTSLALHAFRAEVHAATIAGSYLQYYTLEFQSKKLGEDDRMLKSQDVDLTSTSTDANGVVTTATKHATVGLFVSVTASVTPDSTVSQKANPWKLSSKVTAAYISLVTNGVASANGKCGASAGPFSSGSTEASLDDDTSNSITYSQNDEHNPSGTNSFTINAVTGDKTVSFMVTYDGAVVYSEGGVTWTSTATINLSGSYSSSLEVKAVVKP